jgi:hypothetical protein
MKKKRTKNIKMKQEEEKKRNCISRWSLKPYKVCALLLLGAAVILIMTPQAIHYLVAELVGN